MLPNETHIRRVFNDTCKRYRLLADGDHILVGLSGGKDSLALLELLAERSRVWVPRFRVEAAFVRMANIPYQADEAYLHDFAETLGVKLHIVQTQFDEHTDHRHTHCFLCSWHRRKQLFETAKQLGCNKIALGHHLDDVMQTALLNLTYQGTFSSIRPTMPMDKFPMTLIRPLCRLRERDLQAWAEARGYRKQLKQCPYEDASRRADARNLVAALEQMNPELPFSMIHALGWDTGL